jgi:DNA-binding response OmpR family regulator
MADILIIDDDPVVRSVMKAVLKDAGHQVREAKDGVEGLALAQRHRPALVVTDIVMPEKEGMETIRELRQQIPKIAILAVSGAVNRAFYLHLAGQFGADGVLAKPFSFDDLVASVSDLLNRSEHPATADDEH